jgi:hypothetical protein
MPRTYIRQSALPQRKDYPTQEEYRTAYLAAWYAKNKERVRKSKAKWKQDHREKCNNYERNRRTFLTPEAREHCKQTRQAWRNKNRDRIRQQDRTRYQKNKEKIRERENQRRQQDHTRHPEKYREAKRVWRKKNLKKVREYDRKYYAKNYQTNVQYRLTITLHTRLRQALRKNSKTGSAVRDLGRTIPELKGYLEHQFEPGMSWENWGKGGWHIDHIQPLYTFDLTDPEQLKKAVHYTNLRPLWADENLRRPKTGHKSPLKGRKQPNAKFYENSIY